MKVKNQTIVVKVGTNVLSKKDSYELDSSVLESLVGQISKLIKEDWNVVLVTSGAVGFGKKIREKIRTKDQVGQKQAWAALGQTELINTYSKLFKKNNIDIGQILATKADFSDRQHYLNIRRCITTLLSENILPIINENDSVSVTELMFTDNDELASLIATMLNAKKFIILTNVQGIYKDNTGNGLVKEVDPENNEVNQCIYQSSSSLGKGGMYTKCNAALKTSNMGIDVYIANGKEKDVLLDIHSGKNPGTKFIGKKNTTNIKKWIGFSEDFAKGNITVDQGLEKILISKEKKASILPIGVTNTSGEFEEGDLVEIVNNQGEKIGIGISQYSEKELKKNLKNNSNKEVIHYDSLYIY